MQGGWVNKCREWKIQVSECTHLHGSGSITPLLYAPPPCRDHYTRSHLALITALQEPHHRDHYTRSPLALILHYEPPHLDHYTIGARSPLTVITTPYTRSPLVLIATLGASSP
jgi:hypothetical protein